MKSVTETVTHHEGHEGHEGHEEEKDESKGRSLFLLPTFVLFVPFVVPFNLSSW